MKTSVIVGGDCVVVARDDTPSSDGRAVVVVVEVVALCKVGPDVMGTNVSAAAAVFAYPVNRRAKTGRIMALP